VDQLAANIGASTSSNWVKTGNDIYNTNSANVGIGTNSPSAKLHIKSPANARAIKLQNLQNNSASYILWLDELGAEKSFIGSGTSAGGDADELVFGTNAIERLRIDSVGKATFRSTYIVSGLYGGEVTLGGSSTTFGLQLKYNQSAATTSTIYHSPGYVSTGNLLKLGSGSGNTNQLVLKGDGNVGIGTDSPGEKLHVANGDILLQSEYNATGITDSFLYIQSRQSGNWRNSYIGQTGNNLIFGTGGTGTTHTNATERMRITSGGEVDIVGTVKSGGNQRFGAGPAHGNSSNPGITTKANNTAGVYWNTDGSGGWGGGNFTTNNSDRNMKTNIVPMDINALNIIDSLETKYFNWTEKANKGDTSIRKAGIIAQDLKELMPEAVYGTEWSDEDENTNGLALDENATTALLIKAIQELKAEIEILKNK